MAALTHDFDLAGLRLSAGEGRRLELDVGIQPLTLGSERYAAEPGRVPVELGISRMTGGGFDLRLTFTAAVSGPCMRCLGAAAPSVAVEAREVDVPGGGEEELPGAAHEHRTHDAFVERSLRRAQYALIFAFRVHDAFRRQSARVEHGLHRRTRLINEVA